MMKVISVVVVVVFVVGSTSIVPVQRWVVFLIVVPGCRLCWDEVYGMRLWRACLDGP